MPAMPTAAATRRPPTARRIVTRDDTAVTVTLAIPGVRRIAPLTLVVPPHTAPHPAQAAQWVADRIHTHALMYLPVDVGPTDYTVAAKLDHSGAGTITITEALTNVAARRRAPRTLGTGTVTPE